MFDILGMKTLFAEKSGVEIGGPSLIFKDLLPVYDLARDIDGCNYSASNTWTNQVSGRYEYDEGKCGALFVSEATCLPEHMTARYNFLLASHCLEHSANPIKAMKEWLRVIEIGGTLLVIVPDKRFTFDHRRAITTFEHISEDFVRDVGEDDLSHVEEIVCLHDLALDPPAGTKEQFRARSMNNAENRCLHHHVFDIELMHKIYNAMRIEILFSIMAPPHHLIIVGRKTC